MSILDKLEVAQKRKSKDNVNSLLKRLSLNRIPQQALHSDLLNQSIPDHFEYMKHQDSINEKRPISKILNETDVKMDSEEPSMDAEFDMKNILKDESLK